MNDLRKVLMLLNEGSISVDKAESLLRQLPDKKEKQILVDIKSIDGEKARFNIPLSILSLLKENIIGFNSANSIKDILKEVNFDKLFREVEQKVMGEIANIKTAKGDQVIVNIK